MAAGPIPGGGGGGGGRNIFDTCFTSEDPWGKRRPIAELRGGVPAVVIVEAATYIDVGVQLWATSFRGDPLALDPHGAVQGSQL